ncbi:hypothetical protein GEMRC1_006995 [Eukaryota sp. GEM-RC1]
MSGSVLEQIRAFKKDGLKKTDTVDKSVPAAIAKAQQSQSSHTTSSSIPQSTPSAQPPPTDFLSELQAKMNGRSSSTKTAVSAPPPKPKPPIPTNIPPAPKASNVPPPPPPPPPQIPPPSLQKTNPPPVPSSKPPLTPPRDQPAPTPPSQTPPKPVKKKAPPPPPKNKKPRQQIPDTSSASPRSSIASQDFYANRISPFDFKFPISVPETALPFRNFKKVYKQAGAKTEWLAPPLPNSHLLKLLARIQERKQQLEDVEHQLLDLDAEVSLSNDNVVVLERAVELL